MSELVPETLAVGADTVAVMCAGTWCALRLIPVIRKGRQPSTSPPVKPGGGTPGGESLVPPPDPATAAPAGERRVTPAQLAALEQARRTATGRASARAQLVLAARAANPTWSWPQLGESLGMTGSAARSVYQRATVNGGPR